MPVWTVRPSHSTSRGRPTFTDSSRAVDASATSDNLAYARAVSYVAAADRYDAMQYRRCGRSGLRLPLISLGLWHNFGHDRPFAVQRDICLRAFDAGITHFDLANNYGPRMEPPRRTSAADGDRPREPP
jgi:hypothetical protein